MKKEPSPRRPQLTEQVVFRCSAEQKSLWEQLAFDDDRLLGDWIRLKLDSLTKNKKPSK